MRLELKRLHARLGATMVYVTHDQVEAMTLADRIALLRAGALVQVGTPDELYRRPASLFAARFFGTPEMNAVDGMMDPGEEGARFSAPGFSMLLATAAGGPHTLGFRAEDLALVEPGAPGAAAVAEVEVLENLGWDTLVHLTVRADGGAGGPRLVARVESAKAPRPGERVGLRVPWRGVHLFTPTGERL
jgi:ABC-type sugar transport system ATPase subunit